MKLVFGIPDLCTYLISRLLKLKNKYENNIHEDFKGRLNNRIYSWYVDGDFLLLKFMCHRGAFRKDINEKCLLCEKR